ncbi:alpha/beta fold hydrolase [Streptomyces sp. 061-3]|uniref:alpha/beta fold hydrolase n=1 Tax=Streptomyces sp. 061-3 TaxID=2789268 RepID=UPI00397EFAB8
MSTPHSGALIVSTTLGPLHVQDAGPADGPVALLWPSLYSDGETSWGAQLAGLHALGWRTLLVDPPGTGGSAPASRRFTMEECGDAALQVLDDAGVDRAAFLGLSWGGIMALRVALIAPHRVTALVLSNTTARGVNFGDRLKVRLITLVIRVGVPGGLGRLVVGGMLSDYSRRHDTGFAPRFAETVNNLDTVGLALATRSVLGDRSEVIDALHRITAPTLVIAGAEDKALPQAPHSDDLADRIVGAQLVVLPRVAHLAPRERPSEVEALIKEFLAPLG